MQEVRIASRYAKGLLDLAKEKGSLDVVKDDMDFFVKTADANPEFKRILKNPIVSHEKKAGILWSLFRTRFNPLTLSMFQLLTKKNRESYLYDIAKEFINQYKILKGIVTADIITTFPLTDDLRQSFTRMVANGEVKNVELREKIDKSIIGGYVLKIGDKQVDQSIRAKLKDLNSKFKDNSYIAKY